MRIDTNKLVRDRIPEIIQRDGRRCGIRIASEEELVPLLKAKLIEEAQEAAADDADLVKELADLAEVIDALLAAEGLDYETIRAKQEKRRLERGGFEKRLVLLWTEADPVNSPHGEEG